MRRDHPQFASTQLACLLALSVISIAGCGSDEGRVSASGKVERNGQPVQAASITFTPSADNSGVPAYGNVVDGKFEFSSANGPAPGTNRVTIGLTLSKEELLKAGANAKTSWDFNVTVPNEGSFGKDFKLEDSADEGDPQTQSQTQ